MTNGTSQGLFVIVAVIIFGIFVAIAYNLFGNQLKISLANIFEDSLTQAENALNGGVIGDSGDTDFVDDRVTLENWDVTISSKTYKFAKIRDKGDFVSSTTRPPMLPPEVDFTPVDTYTYDAIYVALELKDDNTYRIVYATKLDNQEDWEAYLKGDLFIDNDYIYGDFKIPSTISGKKITEIGSPDPMYEGHVAFNLGGDNINIDNYIGDFVAPEVTIIRGNAFQGDYSAFTGEFKVPNLEILEVDSSGVSPLYWAEFKGEFYAPKLKEIPESAFQSAKFTGGINLDQVESIGSGAFYNSTFTGAFNAPKLKVIPEGIFASSQFTRFNAPEATSIGESAFLESTFTGVADLSKVTKIDQFAFNNNQFDKIYLNKDVLNYKDVNDDDITLSYFLGSHTPEVEYR